MAKLTRKQERRLRRSADGVRMYVACLTVVAPLLCVWAAAIKYAAVSPAFGEPEISPMATWGNITGIYLPLFAVVGAYMWATRAVPPRILAPHGFAMAFFRDVFTMGVMTVVLLIPPVLYWGGPSILEVNAYVVWYQTVLTAVAGGAFAYYFHGRISVDRPASPRAAAVEKVMAPAAEG